MIKKKKKDVIFILNKVAFVLMIIFGIFIALAVIFHFIPLLLLLSAAFVSYVDSSVNILDGVRRFIVFWDVVAVLFSFFVLIFFATKISIEKRSIKKKNARRKVH